MEDAGNAYRACPFCAEPIRVGAMRCRHCGCDVRAEAVAAFVEQPHGGPPVPVPTQNSAPPPVPVPAQDSAPTPPVAARSPEVSRLTLGIWGYWVFLASCGLIILLLSSGVGKPSFGTARLLLGIFFVALGTVYAFFGVGWVASSSVASRATHGCAAACFLHAFIAGVGLITAIIGNSAWIEMVGSTLFAAHVIYMLALSYWYGVIGVRLLHAGPEPLTPARQFWRHLNLTGLPVISVMLMLSGIVFADSGLPVLGMIITFWCWLRPWKLFYLFRAAIERHPP